MYCEEMWSYKPSVYLLRVLIIVVMICNAGHEVTIQVWVKDNTSGGIWAAVQQMCRQCLFEQILYEKQLWVTLWTSYLCTN